MPTLDLPVAVHVQQNSDWWREKQHKTSISYAAVQVPCWLSRVTDDTSISVCSSSFSYVYLQVGGMEKICKYYWTAVEKNQVYCPATQSFINLSTKWREIQNPLTGKTVHLCILSVHLANYLELRFNILVQTDITQK